MYDLSHDSFGNGARVWNIAIQIDSSGLGGESYYMRLDFLSTLVIKRSYRPTGILTEKAKITTSSQVKITYLNEYLDQISKYFNLL